MRSVECFETVCNDIHFSFLGYTALLPCFGFVWFVLFLILLMTIIIFLITIFRYVLLRLCWGCLGIFPIDSFCFPWFFFNTSHSSSLARSRSSGWCVIRACLIALFFLPFELMKFIICVCLCRVLCFMNVCISCVIVVICASISLVLVMFRIGRAMFFR